MAVDAALRDPLRLRALARSGLMDSAPDAAFDELTALAAEALDAPMALVSLVSADRQFFKSCRGFPEPWASRRGSPLSHSFCQHVVAERAELVVDDAREHPLFRDSVTVPELGVRAYVGVPVHSPDGHVLGTLCVLDVKPRRWEERDLRLLRALARSASQQVAVGDATREARSRLHALETSYREVVDTLEEVVFATDRDGRWTFLSPAWTAVTGYPVAETIGRSFIEFVYPDDRIANAAVFDPLVAGITDDYRHLMRYVHADGSVRWLGARARAVRGAGDAVVGAIGALNDVTARVTAQHALREREDELARARKLEAIGRLAAGIAHDFNNVLAAVGAHAQFLHEDLAAAGVPHEDVLKIIEAVRRGEALARQLLTVSSRIPTFPERVELEGAVRDIAGMLARVLGAGVRVATCFAPALPPVYVDRSQLEQVLLNLLVNARDAMPSGGTVTVATAARPLADGRAGVCLTVRDTGTGMSPEVLAHLFEPFFTTKPQGQGTGLGLATVHGIVTRWGGQVEVDSAPGEGSEFRVTIPAAT